MKLAIKTGHNVQKNFEPDKETDVIPEDFIKPLFLKDVDPIVLDKLKVPELDKEKETEIGESRREDTALRKIYEGEKRVEFLRILEPLRQHFKILQQWAGVVLDVGEDIFNCKLNDMTKDNPEEIAEIPLEEVQPDDLSLVKPGGIFYWSIGYHDTSSGTRKRVSIIRFRRLPAWSKRELDKARIESEEISRKLQWGVDATGINERISE